MYESLWYTDTVDIARVEEQTTEGLTENIRTIVAESVPCLVYQSKETPITFSSTAASVEQALKLMCDNSVDIRAGDELTIHRGAVLGHTAETLRAFATDSNHYYEPMGATMPGLEHQEILLKLQERHSYE